MLERIGRQGHASAAEKPMEFIPVDLVAPAIQGAEARQDLVQLPAPADRAEPRCLKPIEALAPKREERVAGTDFDKVRGARCGEAAHGVEKTDRLERVAAPVLSIRRGGHGGAGDGRYPVDLRSAAA